MSKQFRVKVYQSPVGDGMTCAGTLVELTASFISIYAESAEAAEDKLRTDVETGKLPCGRIYQLCPAPTVAELVRSIAASLDGSFKRVYLDPAAGLYSEKRRVRTEDLSGVLHTQRPLSQVLGY